MTENAQLLSNIINPEGFPVGRLLCQQANSAACLVVIGRPASGKSRLLKEIGEAAEPNIYVDRVSFGAVLACMRNEVGKKAFGHNRDLWDKFTDRMLTKIKAPLVIPPDYDYGTRHVDLVCVDKDNRGLAALTAVASSPGVMVIGIVPDPRITNAAAFERDLIFGRCWNSRKQEFEPFAQGERLGRLLRECLNTVMLTSGCVLSDEEVGSRFKELLGVVAGVKTIAEIEFQVLERAHYLVSPDEENRVIEMQDIPAGYRADKRLVAIAERYFDRKLPDLPKHPLLESLDELGRLILRYNLFDMMCLMRMLEDLYGLPKELGEVVINLYNPGPRYIEIGQK